VLGSKKSCNILIPTGCCKQTFGMELKAKKLHLQDDTKNFLYAVDISLSSTTISYDVIYSMYSFIPDFEVGK